MKITDVISTSKYKGLNPFTMNNLGDIVILTGANGAGKTRLLSLVSNYIASLKNEIKSDVDEDKIKLSIKIAPNEKLKRLTKGDSSQIDIIDYSHYDAKLQNPEDFPAFTIHSAKEHLKKCDIRETALNALLYIEDLSKEYSSNPNEFEEFSIFINDLFGLELSQNDKQEPLLFGQKLSSSNLSPGQQYLLRMAVALHCNQFSENVILFMDEPEVHLHPDALVKLIEKIRSKLNGIQIWIATHSLALISYLSSDQYNPDLPPIFGPVFNLHFH